MQYNIKIKPLYMFISWWLFLLFLTLITTNVVQKEVYIKVQKLWKELRLVMTSWVISEINEALRLQEATVWDSQIWYKFNTKNKARNYVTCISCNINGCGSSIKVKLSPKCNAMHFLFFIQTKLVLRISRTSRTGLYKVVKSSYFSCRSNQYNENQHPS